MRFLYSFVLAGLVVFILTSCEGNEPKPKQSKDNSLIIRISGYSGAADVLVIGPNGFSAEVNGTDTLQNLVTGSYNIRTKILLSPSSPVSKAYRTQHLDYTVLVNAPNQKLELDFLPMPGSGKIWMGNANGADHKRILSYAGTSLGSTALLKADHVLGALTSPHGLAFDLEGNLWCADGAGLLVRFDWSDLDNDGAIPSKSVPVRSKVFSIAFDETGNLWYTTSGEVAKINKESVYSNSSVMVPEVILTSTAFAGLRGLAFDAHGNLWLANANRSNLLMIKSSHLNKSSEVSPEVSLICYPAGIFSPRLTATFSLAFDENDNLFVGYFGSQVIAKLTPSERSSSGMITPEVQLTVRGLRFLNHMAFDEEGHLWLPLSQGQFGRVHSDDLASSGQKTPSVVISSADINYTTGMAFYASVRNSKIEGTALEGHAEQEEPSIDQMQCYHHSSCKKHKGKCRKLGRK